MTRALLPLLADSRRGHIVNVGSVGGFEVYAGGGGYTMTKHAVRAITRTLRLELLDAGIRVTEVAPGLVETDFSLVRYAGDSVRAAKTYRGDGLARRRGRCRLHRVGGDRALRTLTSTRSSCDRLQSSHQPPRLLLEANGQILGTWVAHQVRWAMPLLFVAASVFPCQVLGSLSSLDPLSPLTLPSARMKLDGEVGPFSCSQPRLEVVERG